jgi:predicted ATPase
MPRAFWPDAALSDVYQKHNEARRFITLIDVLYEKRTR